MIKKKSGMQNICRNNELTLDEKNSVAYNNPLIGQTLQKLPETGQLAKLLLLQFSKIYDPGRNDNQVRMASRLHGGMALKLQRDIFLLERMW